MTPLAGLVSLAMPLAIGYSLTGVVGPREPWTGGNGLRLVIAAALGVGACSMLFFLSLATGAPPFLFEACLLTALAIALYGRRPYGKPRAARKPGASARERVLWGLFWVLTAANVVAFGYRVIHWPRGGWDGWAIWNLRARSLYLAADWRDAFSPALAASHTDYPLLIPCFIAREWQGWDAETTLVPILLAGAFAAAVLFVLVRTLHELQGRTHALAAGILFLATPLVTAIAAAQYADVTLSCFFLTALVLQYFADESAEPGRFLVLSGLAAGLAAWTKNEGLLFVAALVAARAVAAGASAGWRTALRQAASLLAGAAPCLALIVYFRRTLALTGDILGKFATPAFAHDLADPHRYLTIAWAYVKHIWSFGNPFVGGIVLLAAYLLCTGIALPRKHDTGFWTGVGVLGVVLAGYFMVYVVTPNDLHWHLDTSLDRLYLQLWPAALWAAMLAALQRDGERADSTGSNVL